MSVVLKKYEYKCTYSRDEEFFTSWLELLVLLKKTDLDMIDIRRLMDHLTWFSMTGEDYYSDSLGGMVELKRFEGTLTRQGTVHTFTPFPRWVRPPRFCTF